MSGYVVDTSRKVCGGTGGLTYTIRPNSDGADLVLLECEERDLYMIFVPEQARLIGEALIACALELGARK